MLSDKVLALIADEASQTSVDEYARLRSALDVCLSDFSDIHRQLLLAPYGESGRIKEMAEQMGKSANAFYKLLGRLRCKLSECVASRLQAVEGV